MSKIEDCGIDFRLIHSKRIARNFRELQLAVPGDGVLKDTVDALIKGEVTVCGFEFVEVKDGSHKRVTD